jgi:hypothetical protein
MPSLSAHPASRRAARTLTCTGIALLLALSALGAFVTRVSPATAAGAHPARTVALDETGHLHLTSKHGFTLNEEGPASGTFAGTIYVHLTLVSTTRAGAEVNIYVAGGSISARASASYRRSGPLVTFSGSMSIASGEGSYRGVRGAGLSFSGQIEESSRDAITVHMSGRAAD